MATTTCEECGRQLRLYDFIEFDELDRKCVLGLCPNGHMNELSQAQASELFDQWLREAEEEWEPADTPHPF